VALLIYRHDFLVDFKTAAAGGINFLFLIGWIFLVRHNLVRMAAVSYSDRLLATCEELTAQN
jgi:hypothetical protein